MQGTPYWMAPEVIKGEPYGERADIWSVKGLVDVQLVLLYFSLCRSIGATIVEMLKCRPPWYEFEPTAAMFKIVTNDTEPNLPPHCSEESHHFLTMCFIK